MKISKLLFPTALVVFGSLEVASSHVDPNDAAHTHHELGIEEPDVEGTQNHKIRIDLNLTVHIMRDIEMTVQDVSMTTDYITPGMVQSLIIPEVNRMWEQADILWILDEVIVEDVTKANYAVVPNGFQIDDDDPRTQYEHLKSIVETAERDAANKSDPRRLVPLFLFMNPENRIERDEFGTNNFHVYIYPFIGNTSQGNAMREMKIPGLPRSSYGFHTVVGAWTNKHNRGGPPEKTLIAEEWQEWDSIDRGSLSRTIAHEVGHVLGLRHDDCNGNCLMGPVHGYLLTEAQITTARTIAEKRVSNVCSPLERCGYVGDFNLFFGE